ncbi:MAG: polysaccharide deacetylase family protein [Verrucomicrobiae bacterium]|nr:polysaccharide deacetylase family protein [Verrucomicrobiae bacterium]
MNGKHLIVSLHDVHPGSLERIREQTQFCENLGVFPLSLLVVPHYHQQKKIIDCPVTVAWLQERQAQGDEMVLHGYYHQRVAQKNALNNWFWTRFYTQNEAEFYDLNQHEANHRIEQGRQLLEEIGLITKGFIAPAWLMSQDVFRVIFEKKFHYTNTISKIFFTSSNSKTIRNVSSRSLCYSTRAKWRSETSLIWNRALGRRLRSKNLIRLSLHPNDLTFPAIRRQVEFFLKDVMEQGFQPITYAGWVEERIKTHG